MSHRRRPGFPGLLHIWRVLSVRQICPTHAGLLHICCKCRRVDSEGSGQELLPSGWDQAPVDLLSQRRGDELGGDALLAKVLRR